MQTLLLPQIALAPLHLPPLPLALPQQGKPSSPHLVQLPLLQAVLGEVHTPTPVLLVQQGNPGPPQLPHTPLLQTPVPRPTHAPPSAMQIPDTQQPPPAQVLPSQQGRPA
jgi:hypothetical protein